MTSDHSITLGISACLLGQKVRYDGGHKREPLITGTLARYFQLMPLCPEVAIGLGVPRPPIQLVDGPNGIRARAVDDPTMDVTERLQGYGRDIAGDHAALRGYILKSRSPSCGVRDTPVYNANRQAVATGPGIYADALVRQRPLLPVTDEHHLVEVFGYESFIRQVITYHRWSQLLAAGLSVTALQQFHQDHRLLIMAHDPDHQGDLNDLVSKADTQSLPGLAETYIRRLLGGLGNPATQARHTAVLRTLLQTMGKYLGAARYHELSAAIVAYGQDAVACGVPIGLVQAGLEDHPDAGLQSQVYLHPHPALGLLYSNPSIVTAVMP